MLSVDVIDGHRALILENELLKVSILPDKGADIYDFVHKPTGVDFLLKTPGGLRLPKTQAVEDFLDNYEGGWQELFPNTDSSCDYNGNKLPFHGEVALLPWEYVIERETEEETALRLTVRCRQTPFEIQRLMRLSKDKTTLEIEEVVTNHSTLQAEFVWGHHLVLGGDFLEKGCRLDIPAKTLITREKLYEPATARLAPGQRERWPLARRRDRRPLLGLPLREGEGARKQAAVVGEEWIDLSYVPGPEVHSHDEILITDLFQGRITVTNPRLHLGLALEWDLNVFPWVILWQPFGGSDAPPLTSIYGLGIEPWVARGDLEQAVKHGKAIKLAAGESFATKLSVRVDSI